MFIRQTKTGSSASNQSYRTYRLVTSSRIGKKVSQKTLLNLGRNFDITRELWPDVCTRIEQILAGQSVLFEVPGEVEKEAQSMCAKIMAVRSNCADMQAETVADFREVDVNSVDLIITRVYVV